jgi:hypothetical protein
MTIIIVIIIIIITETVRESTYDKYRIARSQITEIQRYPAQVRKAY